jgi:hypothetical protein
VEESIESPEVFEAEMSIEFKLCHHPGDTSITREPAQLVIEMFWASAVE